MAAALGTPVWAQRPPVNETAGSPLIYRNRVLNAASLRPAALPGGGIARGSVFSIFGARLGPAAPGVEATAFPLATALAGVRVVLTRGTVSFPAWPVLVSAGQVNAIAPSGLPPGVYSLRVTVNERSSNPMPVRVVDAAPGIYTVNGTGMGPAVAAAAAATPGLAKVSEAAPAAAAESPREMRPGQLASIWVTGLGPIQSADNQRGSVQALANPEAIDIWVGGTPVTAAPFGGRMVPGIDQVFFQIPPQAPEGCFVPVQVRVRGVVSNAATIALNRSGNGRCEDAHSPVAEMMLGGGPSVAVTLLHARRKCAGCGPQASDTDKAAARVVSEQSPTGQFDPYLAPPPPGACTAYSAHGDILRGAVKPGLGGQPLEAGEIVVGNGRAERKLDALEGAPGYFFSLLGGGFDQPDQRAAPLFFEGDEVATVKMTGAGRADSLPPPPRFDSENLEDLQTLERRRPAALRWTLTGDAQVAVFGAAYDRPSDSSTLFFCMAPRGADGFSIPEYVLAQLPASRSQESATEGTLILATFPDANTKTADGQALIGRQTVLVQQLKAIR